MELKSEIGECNDRNACIQFRLNFIKKELNHPNQEVCIFAPYGQYNDLKANKSDKTILGQKVEGGC